MQPQILPQSGLLLVPFETPRQVALAAVALTALADTACMTAPASAVVQLRRSSSLAE